MQRDEFCLIFLPLLLKRKFNLNFYPQFSISTVYYNPFLYTTTMPFYFPVSNTNIGVVVPASYNLDNIKIPNIEVKIATNFSDFHFSQDNYNAFIQTIGGDADLIRANHNLINDEISKAIIDGAIELGCEVAGHITYQGLKYATKTLCKPIPSPTTVIACTVHEVLKLAAVKKGIQQISKEGCTVIARPAANKTYELYIKTKADLKHASEQAKYWLSYINSVDGMIWTMNRMQSNMP